MTQLVLNISDPSVLPTLKKVVKAFKGVTIATSSKKRPNWKRRFLMFGKDVCQVHLTVSKN